ncbi:MAG: hypothetical protein ACFFDC_21265 [Promethearchaeota archaeon]
MVRLGRESFIRFIQTIINLLPESIEKYPSEEQILLEEFLAVLQHYTEADAQRETLSKRFENYMQMYYHTDKYLSYPFLWFAHDFFGNANRLLNFSKFHANTFYEYLVRHLRGSSVETGVFHLIRASTPLTDLSWEDLQYECNKILFPLTSEQLQVLESIYSYIQNSGIYALNPRNIKEAIRTIIKTPGFTRDISRLFALLEAQWIIHFHPPAFGLTPWFFQFQLNESNSLIDILDPKNLTNTPLSLSYLYRVTSFPNTYTGFLIVPFSIDDLLRKYLHECESQGLLLLQNFDRITEFRNSESLALYRLGQGWFNPSPTLLKRLTQRLSTTRPRKGSIQKIKSPPFFMTLPFNQEWNYLQSQFPVETMKLFFDIPPFYSFENLPLAKTSQKEIHLNTTEVGLLKYLYGERVISIEFFVQRLLFEFSLDIYLIKPPLMSFHQLSHLLEYLPHCQLLITEKNVLIITRLTSLLCQWLQMELQWSVVPLRLSQYPQQPNSDMFDFNTLHWKTPEVLTR